MRPGSGRKAGKRGGADQAEEKSGKRGGADRAEGKVCRQLCGGGEDKQNLRFVEHGEEWNRRKFAESAGRLNNGRRSEERLRPQ